MPNGHQSSMVSVTGLWLNTDKHDQKYMAGNCGGVRYWVFKNRNKKKDGDPDYLLKISQNLKPKPEEKPVQYEDALEEETDNIPF